MALLLLEGFADTALADLASEVSAAVGVSAIVDGPRVGAKALYLDSIADYVRLPLSAAVSTVRFSARVLIGALATTSSRTLITLMEGSTPQVGVSVDSTGALFAFRGSTKYRLGQVFPSGRRTPARGTSTTPLLPGVWYTIEGRVVIDDTSGAIELRVDGSETPALVASGLDTNQGSGTVDGIQFGAITGHGGHPSTYGEIAVWSESGDGPTGWLAGVRVDSLRPDGAGDASDWTPSAGEGWECVGEQNADGDTSYVETSAAAAEDLYTLSRLPHSPATIHAVMATARVRRVDADPAGIMLAIKSGASTATSSAQAIASTSYARHVYALDADPDTAGVWSVDALNALQAGVTSVDAETVRATQVAVRVLSSEAQASPVPPGFVPGRCFLVELTAAVDTSGTQETYRYSTVGYNTYPSDTPPDTHYAPRVIQPGFIRQTLAGATVGETILANQDGALDHLLGYGFAGLPITIKVGSEHEHYDSFAVVLSGVVSEVDVSRDQVSIRVRDQGYALRSGPLCQQTYAGGNVLPAGLEGTVDDIEGQNKPEVFGSVHNASPVCCNTAKLIYQIAASSTPRIVNVFDGAAPLTAAAEYTSEAQMMSLEPDPGYYRQWAGYIRLGAMPVGDITITVATAPARSTAAQVIRAIALHAGLADADIDASSLAALDAANTGRVGLYVDDDATPAQCIDRIARSIGAWWGFDRSGRLIAGMLAAPTGTPDAILGASEIAEVARVTGPDGLAGVPAWQVRVKHSRNWTVQRGSLAPTATSERRAFVQREWRAAVREDASVKAQYQDARTIERESCFFDGQYAAIEAARLLALYKSRRDVFELTCYLSAELSLYLRPGAVILVTHPRLGLQDGRLCRIVGYEPDYRLNRCKILAWG